MDDNRRMTMVQFDSWQSCLRDFALEHGRACTANEWRWLKMFFDTREFAGSGLTAYSLAADGENLNSILAGERTRTQRNGFHSSDGSLRVEIVLRSREGSEDPVVHVKMTDDEGRPVEGGKISFPGLNDGLSTDRHGRLTLAYRDYLSYLQRVMSISCSRPNGEPQRMEMD